MRGTSEILLYDPKARLYADHIRREVPDACVIPAIDIDTALLHAGRATALIALAHNVTGRLIEAMPALRWIQALTTGIDPLLRIPALKRDVVLTTARGIPGPQMSELAFTMMFALLRDLPRMLDNQKARAWERWPQPLLDGKTVLIVGVGSIAEDLAVRCKAFQMTVVGVSRRTDDVPGFDVIEPRERLIDAATTCDILILLTPGTPENRGLISREILSAMKPSAILLNLARGECIDGAALIDALRAGRIAGAALDVFEQEPLPADHPFWDTPRILITPHIGGFSDRYVEQMTPLLAQNVRAFIADDPAAMRNRVTHH